MSILYEYKGKTYRTLDSIQRLALKNVSIPANPSDKLLSKLGIKLKDTNSELIDSKAQQLKRAKEIRELKVENLTVIVNNNSYNADQKSQISMSNMINYMKLNGKDVCDWIMSDKSIVQVTIKELEEAYSLAVEEYSKLWLSPYKDSK